MDGQRSGTPTLVPQPVVQHQPSRSPGSPHRCRGVRLLTLYVVRSSSALVWRSSMTREQSSHSPQCRYAHVGCAGTALQRRRRRQQAGCRGQLRLPARHRDACVCVSRTEPLASPGHQSQERPRLTMVVNDPRLRHLAAAAAAAPPSAGRSAGGCRGPAQVRPAAPPRHQLRVVGMSLCQC